MPLDDEVGFDFLFGSKKLGVAESMPGPARERIPRAIRAGATSLISGEVLNKWAGMKQKCTLFKTPRRKSYET